MCRSDAELVSLNGKLSQFLRVEAQGDSDEPEKAYWEANWQSVTDRDLRHALRQTRRLGTHGGFFRRHLVTGARILEAGCGTGFWVRRLQQNGYRVTGVDYAVSSLRRSKSVAPDLDLSAGDLFRLPYPNDTFDAYLSFGVIEHLVDGPKPILDEALRVLKPGGAILVSVPFRNARRKAVRPMTPSRAQALGLRFHQYFFTLDELHACLKEAAFEVVPDQHAYDVWHGLGESAPNVQRLLQGVPGAGKLAHLADYLPFLPGRAAHMIFAAGRKRS